MFEIQRPGYSVAPRPEASLCLVCVPWFDANGKRRADAWVVQHKAQAAARGLGACPIAPYVEEQCADKEGWDRYLHALTVRCDAVWLVTLDGWEENPDVQRVLTWARQHAIQVHRWAP